MMYRTLKWITGIALHWFYREIRVVGKEKIPACGPLLIAVNHQNALVDSLIAGWIVPRRITMTAKATLADNPFIAVLFRLLGVVPLRRVSDEVKKVNAAAVDRSRNAEAFREILSVLSRQGAVLIFPEGKSHNAFSLEPLKSGLARLAIQARDAQSIKAVRILPVGLIFEEKGTPGTIVGVRVGNAIDIDSWPTGDHAALTQEIAKRLRLLSEDAGLPLPEHRAEISSQPLSRLLIAFAAWWGRVTHRLPVKLARAIAVRCSTDADQPAMLTITLGIGLVLLSYLIHLVIIGVLIHSFWISCLYLAGLLSSAYWAAFERHPRRY